MKSILDLLKRMDESDKYESRLHSIRIFSDGCGCIMNDHDNNIYSWVDKEEMTTILNKIDAELSNTENKWVL